jgi:hypothetical protein
MTEQVDTQEYDVEDNIVEFSAERIDGIHEYGPNESLEAQAFEDEGGEALIGETDGEIYILLSTSDGVEEISVSCMMAPEQASELGNKLEQLSSMNSENHTG